MERQLTVSHFRIGFLKKIVPLKILVGLDSLAQLTGEAWQLSPSVFVETGHQENVQSSAAPDSFFTKCPACSTALEDTPPELVFRKCGQRYPVENRIYDFRLLEINK